jgi:hypothetical protein
VKLGSAPESSGKIREETVVLAASAKDGSIVVLRKEDGAVLKLSLDSARVLTPDSTLVRSHKLLEFSERDLEWLSIKHAGKEQRFAHRTDGSYELQTPKGFAVDPGLVSDVVDGLATLSTDRWLADQDDGSFGLQKPNLEVHLSIDMHDAGSNGERVLRIGDTTGGGAAATIDGTPGVFVFPKRVVNALEIPLIDRSAFVVDGATTQRIELEREGRKIVLEKQGNEFVDRSPHAELSKGRIQQIIDALASMRAEAAVHTGPELPSEGLNRPQLRVFAESQTKGGEPPKTMRYRVGAADSWRSMTVVYARADGVDASFVIARSKIDEILDAL